MVLLFCGTIIIFQRECMKKTRACYLCGKPSFGRTCRECFIKGKNNSLSRLEHTRKARKRKKYER